METLSIAEAKRDLSRVINKVAFGHKPVVLTSRGRPKAVLLGHQEFVRLVGEGSQKVIRLGGLWAGTPRISAQEFRQLRAQVWGRFGARGNSTGRRVDRRP